MTSNQVLGGIKRRLFLNKKKTNIKPHLLHLKAYHQRKPTGIKRLVVKRNVSRDDFMNVGIGGVGEKALTNLNRLSNKISTVWSRVEKKPTVISLALSASLALWTLSNIMDSFEELPLVAGSFEVIGTFVSGWFIYRFVAFDSDREELRVKFVEFFKKIYG